MKTLRIRKWMVIGMFAILVLPWLSYLVVHAVGQHVLQPWSSRQSQEQAAALDRITLEITSHVNEWHDPAWQISLQKELRAMQASAIIYSPSSAEILSSKAWGHPMHPTRETVVVENGVRIGTVDLFMRSPFDPVAAASAAVAMVFAVVLVSFQMRRYVVRPLEAMSHAARRIAGGDLDFQVPSSRVTEIAEVRSAFNAMGEGLRESIVRQAKLEEERRFFVGAIAHDLRTPLFALRGYLDGLEQGIVDSPEKISKYLSVCKEKSEHIDRLVSDLFAFTKLEYMEQTARHDEVDLAIVMTNAIYNIRASAKAKEVSIVVDLLEQKSQFIGDAGLLERAFSNLLDNALRHTTAQGKVFVRLVQEADTTVVSVRDTGPGFSSVDLAHAFEPLYRGESSRNRETGGSGLGLTIARRIFRAHGGDLVASNHPGGGAMLTGYLKRA